MVELAGFDVVLQIARASLAEVVNYSPITFANQSLYLLGGPFSVDLPLDSINNYIGAYAPQAPFISGVLRLLCVARLDAIPQTTLCRISLTVTGGSLQLDRFAIGGIKAWGTNAVPILFAKAPKDSPTAPDMYYPAINVGASSTDFDFEQGTEKQLNDVWGPAATQALRYLVRDELHKAILTLAPPNSNGLRIFTESSAFGFSVREGIESASSRQLSAIPMVMWSDGETLGMFGYYRKVANGGNIYHSFHNYLVQERPEYVYINPNTMGETVVPGYRFALLISAQGFKQTIACPAIKRRLVRDIVKQQVRPYYVGMARQAYSDQFRKLANSQGAKPEDVEKIVEGTINAWADATAEKFLDGDAGQARIDANTPAPCGTAALIVPMDVEFPLPNRSAILWISLIPGQGQLDFMIKAYVYGLGSVITGVTANFQATGNLKLQVGNNDNIMLDLHMDPVDVEADIGGFFGAYLSLLGANGLAEFVIEQVAEDKVESKLDKYLSQKVLDEIEAQLQVNPYKPKAANVDIQNIEIDPAGIVITSLISVSQNFNKFNPGIKIEGSQTRNLSEAFPPTMETFHFAGNVLFDCAEKDYVYEHQWWDDKWTLRLQTRDIPFPIVAEWSLELGCYSAQAGLVSWDGVTRPLDASGDTPNTVTFAGTVRLEPEHFEQRDVLITYTGDPLSGWKLNNLPTDGSYLLRVTVNAVDGVQNQWRTSTILSINGDAAKFGSDYTRDMETCRQRAESDLQNALAELPPLVKIGKIPPWTPVWDPNPEPVWRDLVHQAIIKNQDDALKAFELGVTRYGTEFAKGLLAKPLSRRR